MIGNVMNLIKAVVILLILLTAAGVEAEIRVTAYIIRVSDGDTVWVRTFDGRKLKVRIWGIDTPEKFRSRKLEREALRCGVSPGEIRKLGKAATRKAKELLDHSKVTLIEKGRGYYGRVLGILVLPDGSD